MGKEGSKIVEHESESNSDAGMNRSAVRIIDEESNTAGCSSTGVSKQTGIGNANRIFHIRTEILIFKDSLQI